MLIHTNIQLGSRHFEVLETAAHIQLNHSVIFVQPRAEQNDVITLVPIGRPWS